MSGNLRKQALIDCDYKVFKKTINEKERKYDALALLRGRLAKLETSDGNTKKIRFLQHRMKKLIKSGVAMKKRIPGTGTRVVVKVPYKDTAGNQKAGRVGQTYDKVVWQDAEYDLEAKRKMRKFKFKRPAVYDAEGNVVKKQNVWITAMQQAKQNLGAPSFVTPKKEVTDPSDEKQVMGHKVYVEAKRILGELQAARAADKAAADAAEAEANPGLVEVEAETAEAAPKKRKRKSKSKSKSKGSSSADEVEEEAPVATEEVVEKKKKHKRPRKSKAPKTTADAPVEPIEQAVEPVV